MGAAPRSITIVSSHYHPHLGGVERYVGLQAKECVRLGFDVRIVTHDTERVGFLEEQPGLNIYRLRCWSPLAHHRLPFPVSLLELYRVAHALTSSPSDLTIVHTRYFLLSVFGCLLARCSGSPLVLVDHSSDYIRLGTRWLNGLCHVYEHFLTLVIMLFRPRVFGVARASVTWLRRFGIRRAGVCYNGVDLGQRLDSPVPLSEIIGSGATKKVILAVGRLVKEKGIMELVEGFERFAGKRDDYVLVIVGHGELEPRLRAVAQSNAKILLW
jgi:glycosyltransferase involved in cell wall biosynthesis